MSLGPSDNEMNEVASSSGSSVILTGSGNGGGGGSNSSTTTESSISGLTAIEAASNEGLPPPTPPDMKRMSDDDDDDDDVNNEADSSTAESETKKLKLDEEGEAEKKKKTTEEVWIPIESDPDILTQFLRRLTYTEHYLLDVPVLHEGELQELLAGHSVKAFLFLYQINERTTAEVATSAGAPDPPEDLFFMRQTIRNSCATVALVHAYMNTFGGGGGGQGGNGHVTASIIKEFAGAIEEQGLNQMPNMPERWQAIGELFAANKQIKSLHLEHAILGQSGVPVGRALDDVDNHYVALVGREGVLYRLDGRCEKPLPMGEYEEEKEEVGDEAGKGKENAPEKEKEEESLSFFGASIQALSSLIARDPDNYNFNILAFCAPKQK
ncbi:PREDICTED: ubiquitin carboxyl-terminal hydrolase-like [Rhagoletis zephyria]|uniref:ubiquitin carboxyl-terminal hydrolase-like n=1 Tax=Rhagoletis zephyria TaxID=28612 RepID=UPI000811968C|nr:PREDICTED: ubiquitin carboxyl-terminal hydrolase-like [Rhagoletis zephyria]